MDYLKEYKKWCESDEFDQATKEELLKIKDDEIDSYLANLQDILNFAEVVNKAPIDN